MKRLLATTAIVCGALWFHPPHASADVIYTINSSNDTGVSGAGPFAQVDIHFVNSTTATATFSRLDSFTFGEMGLDINASTFSITGLQFVLAPGSSTPTYTVVMGGKVGGIGNFALDYSANPNGFSDSVVEANFTIHDTSGTWADETQVLTSSVPEAAVHAFVGANGNSFFASGGPSNCNDCVINPTDGGSAPEPATIALLGIGLLGTLAAARRKRS
jgi:hypothetical protein